MYKMFEKLCNSSLDIIMDEYVKTIITRIFKYHFMLLVEPDRVDVVKKGIILKQGYNYFGYGEKGQIKCRPTNQLIN